MEEELTGEIEVKFRRGVREVEERRSDDDGIIIIIIIINK